MMELDCFVYKFLNKIAKVRESRRRQKDLAKKTSIPPHVDYVYNRKIGIDSHSEVFTPEMNAIISHSILNKIKEENLKQKVAKGKKVNVCFIVTYISRLTFISIYEAMLKSEIFNPYIVLYCAHENYFIDSEGAWEWNEHKRAFQFLKEKGYVVYNGFDEDKNIIPIENFKPDIVFSADINLDYMRNHLTNISLNINYLVCYLCYFFNAINSYSYYYNNRAVSTGWKYFVQTREDYKELVKYSKYCGTNAVLMGYPKLDALKKDECECKIFEKIDNGNPIVIYAPHWTVNHQDEFASLSTFHYYWKYFLNLVKKNPQINFVFKPHPELRPRLNYLNIMKNHEFDEYAKEWDSLPNGVYMLDGDYIDLFKRSDLLIQDSVSFIGEWLPTGKPCMYLVNPKRKQETYMASFSNIGKKIIRKYYLCRDLKEIEKYFNMIMFEKNDPMKEDRVKLIDEIYINLGCTGQKITDYLTDLLTD